MNDPKSLWQNQESKEPMISLNALRERLQKIHRKIAFQTISGGVVGLFALILFGYGFVRSRQLVDRIGWVIVSAGTLYLLVPSIYRHYKLRRRTTLMPSAGMNSSLQFYREVLQSCARRRVLSLGTLLIFGGLGILLISPIRRTYQLLYESGSLNLTPWMPFIALLALWIVLAIVLTRRNRSWIRREFETLEALERENR